MKKSQLMLKIQNSIEVFENPIFGQIRMSMVDDEPMFCLVDVCRALEMSNSRIVADRLDEDERRKLNLPRQGETWFVTESGLYAVIVRSDKPNARKFRKWVTSEVLPSIRKTGSYNKPMTTARKLYAFLEMDKSHYSRWVKANIVDNEFATENEDYFYSPSMANESSRGNFADDYKLTAHFAKNRWNSKKGI